MTDTEFNKLKKDIESKTIELERLKALYRQETGRNFVMPLYLEKKA